MAKNLESRCKQDCEDTMEFLLGVSEDLIERGKLSAEDMHILCKVWGTISSIKTIQAMDAGTNWLGGKR